MTIDNRIISAFSNKVADLADRPNLGSTAALKARFDACPEELRVALNGLITDLMLSTDGNAGADSIGVTPISTSPSKLQGVLEWLHTQISAGILGQIPDGSITPDKMASDPIASYTHTGNKEVVVSAVDTATDTFTSTAHGLSNNDIVYFVSNRDAGNIYPLAVIPGNFAIGTPYYVVNSTADTFQLSSTQGGAARDITVNATLDLTKFHIERLNSVVALELANIPSLKKAIVKVSGRSLRIADYIGVTVNNYPYDNEYATSAVGTYTKPDAIFTGDIWVNCDTLIDFNDVLTVLTRVYSARSNTTIANSIYAGDRSHSAPKYRGGSITSVNLYNFYPSNGFKVEVYKTW